MLAPNFTPFPTLTTTRLMLRKITSDDVQELFFMRTDDRVMKYIERPRPKNIQETLKTTEYARLRFGVGSEFSKGRQVDYVLGKWNEEEQTLLIPRIKLATEMIHAFVATGLQLAMTNYNNK